MTIQDPNKPNLHPSPDQTAEPVDRPYEESADAKFAHSLSNKPGSVAHPRGEEAERTITNRPADPNDSSAGDFPPGIDADTARDPGANTETSRTVEKP